MRRHRACSTVSVDGAGAAQPCGVFSRRVKNTKWKLMRDLGMVLDSCALAEKRNILSDVGAKPRKTAPARSRGIWLERGPERVRDVQTRARPDDEDPFRHEPRIQLVTAVATKARSMCLAGRSMCPMPREYLPKLLDASNSSRFSSERAVLPSPSVWLGSTCPLRSHRLGQAAAELSL